MMKNNNDYMYAKTEICKGNIHMHKKTKKWGASYVTNFVKHVGAEKETNNSVTCRSMKMNLTLVASLAPFLIC